MGENEVYNIKTFIDTHDIACITAFRKTLENTTDRTLDDRPKDSRANDKPYEYTDEKNNRRNKDLYANLIYSRYGVTEIPSSSVENCKVSCDKIWFVVNIHNDPDFYQTLFNLSEYYNQDYFLYKARNKQNAYLIGTNKLKYNQKENTGNFDIDINEAFLPKRNTSSSYPIDMGLFEHLGRFSGMAVNSRASVYKNFRLSIQRRAIHTAIKQYANLENNNREVRKLNNDIGIDNILHQIDTKGIIIISACLKTNTLQQNQLLTQELLQDIIDSKYVYTPIFSAKKDIVNNEILVFEAAFIVYNSTLSDFLMCNKDLQDFESLKQLALKWCVKYNQESVYIQPACVLPDYYDGKGNNKSVIAKNLDLNRPANVFLTVFKNHPRVKRQFENIKFENSLSDEDEQLFDNIYTLPLPATYEEAINRLKQGEIYYCM